jgi:hypothetical protein
MKVGLLIMDEDPREALRVAKAADQAGIHSMALSRYGCG